MEISNVKVELSLKEKIFCLEEIAKKIKKILHVYEKSLEPNNEYDYKIYITGVLFYVKSSDDLFGGSLISIMVNLNSIIINDFDKKQIKRITMETLNLTNYLLKQEKELLESRGE